MIFYNVTDLSRFATSIALAGRAIGITSGCFDLLHPLHVEYLNKCKRECCDLIVLIDSDKLTFKQKGKVPLINEADRAYMVDNLQAVDMVMIMDNLDELKYALMRLSPLAIHPGTPIKCFKHSHNIYNTELISVEGVENVIIPDVIRFQSTTEIKDYLKNK